MGTTASRPLDPLAAKVVTMVLNAQGGKTRRIQDLIKEENEAAGDNRPLNILFQANNRSLVDQTASRMDELYDDDKAPADLVIEGGVLRWHSGGKTKVTPDEVAGKILYGDIDMIVCCSNRTRFNYVSEIIRKMAAKKSRFCININLWFDEADSYVHFLNDAGYKEVAALPCIKKVTMVTATVDALVKTFGAIKVMSMEETTLPMYVGLSDYKTELVPGADKTPAEVFVRETVLRHPERYLAPGTRIFAPGAVKRASHEAIAKTALELGMAVVLLNGLKKEIRMPTGEVIPLPRSCDTPTGVEELGKTIARLYKDHGLERFPLVVTGNICLGRGITFQNVDFLFDHMILASVFDTRAGAYQAAGRGLGNVRELPAFKARAATGFQPTLVTTECMRTWLTEAEQIAGTLAKTAHTTGRCMVTKDDLDIGAGDHLLALSEVPTQFDLPASLWDIKDAPVGSWPGMVLTALQTLSPALHAQLTTGEWIPHVNNYTEYNGNYRSKFRPVKDAAHEKRRNPVLYEVWVAPKKNTWYALADHINKTLVVGCFMGAAIAEWSPEKLAKAMRTRGW